MGEEGEAHTHLGLTRSLQNLWEEPTGPQNSLLSPAILKGAGRPRIGAAARYGSPATAVRASSGSRVRSR